MRKIVVDVYRVPLAGPARSGCADAALERILTHALGHPPRIVRGEHGKPRLAEGTLAFNVAHSGAWAVIALAASDVGIDIEQHRPLDAAVLAARYFTPAEAAAVRREPAQFFRVWARKEAWLKARGVGVLAPLNEVDVRGAVAGWLVEDLAIAPGYSAAVAAPVGSLDPSASPSGDASARGHTASLDPSASPSGDASARGHTASLDRSASPSGDASARGHTASLDRSASPSGDASARGHTASLDRSASPSGDASARGHTASLEIRIVDGP